MMVDVRQCRGCGFPVVRIAAMCPKCKKAAPGYTDQELTVRRWKLLLSFIGILALVAAFTLPGGS